MAVSDVDSAAVIEALTEEWAALRELFGSLTAEQMAAASVLPGWSNADILAHIIGTESLLAGRKVPEHDVSGRAHVKNPIGELNEKWLEELRPASPAELLALFDEITAERTAALGAMSPAELAAETMTPAGPDSYARFMRIRDFDCWIHELDVRDGLGLTPPLTARPAAVAVDEAAASLPYVLAKRVGVPKGNTVAIALTGLVDRVLVIEVADRARLVPPGGAAPDVALDVDTCDFFRLIGGRRDADPATVRIIGDKALGEQIASNLAYTI
ncbi:MAG: maleylpyruvate isomerase N-terminal domain-containing protein [Gordonia sp. (in: high G+C Gram-positive bacteria)]|uniref:maleylpyruvate isomerase N-terminal domain-containing protein n=1 Tax=Gordonia sp. (in: high G+C Gram-positive bacteria) TaxID=84139 RepID=UPI0039E38A6B